MGTKLVNVRDYHKRLPDVKLDDPLITRYQREVTKQLIPSP